MDSLLLGFIDELNKQASPMHFSVHGKSPSLLGGLGSSIKSMLGFAKKPARKPVDLSRRMSSELSRIAGREVFIRKTPYASIPD